MILSRVIEHVKSQHWTAVFLDFVIVVLGVFIAFQITTWNEGRADRKKEALYLSELIEGLNADLAEIDAVKRTAEIRMGVLEEILPRVNIKPRRTLTYDGHSFTFDPAPPFHSDDPYEGNIELTATPHLDGSRETFQALISTGDIGLIRNRRLARQIQTYYAAVTETNNLESSVHGLAMYVNASRLRLGVSLSGRVTIDQLGALAATDKQFRADLESYWTGSAFQARYLRQVRRDAKALIAAIKTESGK